MSTTFGSTDIEFYVFRTANKNMTCQLCSKSLLAGSEILIATHMNVIPKEGGGHTFCNYVCYRRKLDPTYESSIPWAEEQYCAVHPD